MKGILKRSLSLLLALAIIFPIFGNIATSLAGSGIETDPYTVAEAIANNTGTGYVEGYVVGYRTNNAVTTDIPASPSNIVISDTKGDTSINTTLPVQLSSTSGIRNNADITTVGNKVRLYGSLETYFTKPGLKNVKDGTLVEEAPVETSTETVQETPVETVVETPVETVEETVEENLPTTNANLSIYIAENGQWNDILKLHEQRLGDLRLNDDSKGAYTLNQNGQPLYTHNNINTDKSSITFADVKHGEYTVKLTLPEGYTIDERTFDGANISRSTDGNFNITVNGTTYSQNYSIFLSKDTSVTRETITFTFDANGGVFNDSSSEKVLEFEKNTKYTMPEMPVREGYRSLGWYTASGQFINAFSLQNLTEDTVLTHRWQRQHTITFENNTASADGVNTIKPIKADEGKLYTLPNPYPAKTQNYEFMGWDLDGDGKVDKQVGEKIEITADTILYYVWKDLNAPLEHTLTFKLNKEVPGVTAPEAITGAIGSEVTLPELTREQRITDSYSFLGYDTNADGKVDAQAGDKVVLDADKEVVLIYSGNYGKMSYTFHTDEYKGDNWRVGTVTRVEDLTGFEVVVKDSAGNVIEDAPTTSKGTIWFEKLPADEYTFEIKLPENYRLIKVVDANSSASTSYETIVEYEGNTIKLPFVGDALSLTKSLYIQVEEIVKNTVTIDTSEEGVTIDEAKKVLEANENGEVTLPYTFESKLDKEGFTFKGYEVVSGTVTLNGETVTKLTEYQRDIVISSDVVLKPIFEATKGEIQLIIKGLNQDDQNSLNVIAIDENGVEYPLTVSSYSQNEATWKTQDQALVNGKYTVKITGLDGKVIDTVEAFGHPDVQANTTYALNEDGTISIDVKFIDGESYNSFARFNVNLKDAEYTLTYKLNKEVPGVTAPESVTGVSGTEVTLPELSREERITDSYSFLGYDTDGDGKFDAQAGDKVVLDADKEVVLIYSGNYGKIGFTFHTGEFTGDMWKVGYVTRVEDLTGFEVIVKDSAGNVIEDVPTTSKGTIRFEKLPADEYTFEIKLPENYRLVKLHDGNATAASSYETLVEFEGNIIKLPFVGDALSLLKSIYVQVEEVPMNEANEPVVAPQEVEYGSEVKPEDSVTNLADLPEGTKVTFKEPVDTTVAGEKEVTVVVTYPDGTTEEVVTKVTVKEKAEEKLFGWVQNGDKWNYYDKDGSQVISGWRWAPILDENGQPTGKFNWKYFDSKGNNITQIYTENGKSWLSQVGPTEEYYRGWWINPETGSRYFFRLTSGSMVTGRQFIDGHWMYFRESGTVALGWQFFDGNWNFLDRKTGYQAISEWKWAPILDAAGQETGKSNWKYFNAKGYSITQIYTENGTSWLSQAGPTKEYYRGWWTNPETGSKYFFRLTSGSMVKGEQKIDGSWRFFRTSGTMATGWQKIGEVWKYYKPVSGERLAGRQIIDGKVYQFSADGALIGNR